MKVGQDTSDSLAKATPNGTISNGTISIDAMSGDRDSATIIAGLNIAVKQEPDIRFLVHGNTTVIAPLLKRYKDLAPRCEIHHVEKIIAMDEKPSHALRHGQDSSMSATILAVKNKQAAAAVSCGNTGALMAMSMVALRKLPNVYRPAIAVLWPSMNPAGFNVILDMGADIRADAPDLLKYALMGASYARNGLGIKHPRIGLLNVGTEEHKGRSELRESYELMAEHFAEHDYKFIGFVEGNDFASDAVDVIVTDGFSGNIALKASEGTARLIRTLLVEVLTRSLWSKFVAFLMRRKIKNLNNRIDPRQVNGGVFLGLNGIVIKSHGDADATGIAAAVGLAYRLTKIGFQEKIAARVALSTETAHNE